MKRELCIRTCLLVGVLLLVSGCASAPPPLPVAQASAPEQVFLAAGDQIEIKFAYSQEFNEIQTVRQDGKIELQFVGEVAAAGKTPVQLRDELQQLFAQHLKYPQLTVLVRMAYENRVYVGGEVKTPGMIEMPGRITALEAIMQAGGFNLQTATKNVVVVRQQAGRSEAIPLDLDAALEKGESAAAFYLEPRDVVFVPQSTIVSVNQWIEQYINRITPDIGFTIQRRSASGRTTWGYDTGD